MYFARYHQFIWCQICDRSFSCRNQLFTNYKCQKSFSGACMDDNAESLGHSSPSYPFNSFSFFWIDLLNLCVDLFCCPQHAVTPKYLYKLLRRPRPQCGPRRCPESRIAHSSKFFGQSNLTGGRQAVLGLASSSYQIYFSSHSAAPPPSAWPAPPRAPCHYPWAPRPCQNWQHGTSCGAFRISGGRCFWGRAPFRSGRGDHYRVEVFNGLLKHCRSSSPSLWTYTATQQLDYYYWMPFD